MTRLHARCAEELFRDTVRLVLDPEPRRWRRQCGLLRPEGTMQYWFIGPLEANGKAMAQANRIDHECVSVDSLVQYLKQTCGCQNVQVQKEQHDPPDFWLRVDGNRFAVEETSIVTQETVTKKGFAGLKWEGEAQADLARLIQGAVSRKRKKLESVPQHCRDIILLLYDAYGYGDAGDAKIAFREVHGYDWFHSIFWAAAPLPDPRAGTPRARPNELYPREPGRPGFFLYTKEDAWER